MMEKISFKKIFNKYAWPLRKAILLLIGVAFVANIVTAVQPVVFAGIISIIIGQQANPAEQHSVKILDLNYIGSRLLESLGEYSHDKWQLLIILVIFYLILVIIASLLSYASYCLSLRTEQKAVKLIQLDILKHLLTLSLSFFNHQKSGDLMSRIIQDAKNTANGIGPLFVSLVNNGILIIIYSAYLFSTNALLTIVAFFLILTQFGLTEIIRKPIGKTVRGSLDKAAQLSSSLQEFFTSIRVVKCFGGEKHELKKLEDDIEAATRADVKSGTMRHMQEPTRNILDAFAMVGIVLIATQQLMKGALSIQGFALFIFVGQLLINPINKSAVTISWIYSLLVSYSRINEIFSIKPKIVDGSVFKNDFNESIEIKNLSFSYGAGLVLEGISLQVKKGEIVAIVGPSGAGKSTLIDLILRFYQPLSGNIYMDGISLGEFKYDEYRKLFGIVPQQNLLFNDTVRNNILYGRMYLTEEDVIRSAKIANAHDFIMNLPSGYDTIVGEKGVFLSGGQCQRVAIARAVVSNPPILILDEATSSLDSESERQVQQAIDRVLENSTAIVIAHRLSTVLHAHKIIVMQKGKVEAIGRHQDLLKESPTYQMLYNLQFRSVKINSDNE